MRFENVDDNPEVRTCRSRYSAWGDKALRVPHFKYPLLSIAQEPSIVRLPDQRLFCVMRTNSGYIWYSLSSDDGETWCNPRRLLRKDLGRPILSRWAADPIYQLADGRYVLLSPQQPRRAVAGGENDATAARAGVRRAGRVPPGADQPIWFSESKQFMATGGVGVDGVQRPLSDPKSGSLSMYASFTNRHGNDVLWYPDSKFFLLGKRITADLLAGLTVPAR